MSTPEPVEIVATVRPITLSLDPKTTVHHIELRGPGGVWPETVGGRHEVDRFLRAVQAGASLASVPGACRLNVVDEPPHDYTAMAAAMWRALRASQRGDVEAEELATAALKRADQWFGGAEV